MSIHGLSTSIWLSAEAGQLRIAESNLAIVERPQVLDITGGGLLDNIPRVLPDGLEAVLERRTWRREPVFEWLQRHGQVADAEMYRVFNCGIGMTVHVAAEDAGRAIRLLREMGQEALVIGEIRAGTRGVVVA